MPNTTSPFIGGPDISYMASASSSGVDANLIDTSPGNSSSSRNTAQCPQGICQVENNDGPSEVLETHHRNFLTHKMQWEKERRDMLQTITNLRAEMHQNSLAKGSDIAMSDRRESAGNQVKPASSAQSSIVATLVASPKAIVSPFASIKENVAPESEKSFEESYQEAKGSYRFSSSLRSLKYADSARSKTAMSSLGSRSAQSPSSTAPSSFSQDSPSTPVQDPAWILPLPSELKENMVKHAGHTPMARTGFGLDGASAATRSVIPTPTTEAEQEAVPSEPLSSDKRPSERSDSYFSSGSIADDPELQQPLTLAAADSGDDPFVLQLMPRLQKEATNPTPPTAASASDGLDEEFVSAEEMGFEQPEDGPPLRFKRSMNFGSQLGGINRPGI